MHVYTNMETLIKIYKEYIRLDYNDLHAIQKKIESPVQKSLALLYTNKMKLEIYSWFPFESITKVRFWCQTQLQVYY